MWRLFGRFFVTSEGTDRAVLRRLLGLFAVFAAICFLAGMSRMHPSAWQQVSLGGEVVRVREALSMFVFAPALAVMFWLLYRCLARGQPQGAMDVLMVLSVYFVACGMGIHDPTNRLESVYRYAGALSPEARRSLAYLDDQLGHWVFWCGFVLATWVMGVQQAIVPLKERMTWPWRIGFVCVSAALLWVMLTNLWDEYPKTRADLCVIAVAVWVPFVAHLVLCRRVGLLRLPVLLVIYLAYFGSIAGTLLCWLVRYGQV
jgi:hypothetical protein